VKPPGSLVRLYYDGRVTLQESDYLRTTTTGRLYRVHSSRVQTKGKHAGRQHLWCVVMEPGHKPPFDAVVAPIQWYARNRRR
jgi:hypothetical protein